ncbi:MAG: Histidinol-phosphate aminotransferase [Alphaproteobacteria bacterium MarineAlpha5_Bin5]|nr:MAG: Histidinol-phosphate aminotransferase [Alphaproteobacteria bacterium MarineAlpha5_Bin5]PPR52817.1 MAG: Histidinol-phosphate aminotransferase [Alphaproteobacteria bacterium MarineAlpha5_Bin4]|tara:strand:- start:6974 stop:8323 length:1350 start_codon:yes stop_codon:yes gene_type:complete
MKNDELDNLRKKINVLDDKILDLLKVRADVVSEIGKHKNSLDNIVDLSREQKVLDRLITNSNTKYSKDSIVRIWRELFQASTKLQKLDNEFIQTKRTINSLQIYKGGKSNINGKTNAIKLSSNENSYGPSPTVFEILNSKNFFSKSNRYPQINGESLRRAISKHHNIAYDNIVLGCGSDETLLFAALAFCQDGDEIIHAEHGFEMYPIISKIVGATSKTIKENNKFNITVDSICNEITVSTKLIFLANPNNPTGTYLNRSAILELMEKIPKHIIVVLDGAYAEYVMQKDFDKGFSLADQFDNIILTRTFSKVYGLAGLRIGWCYSSKKVCDILNKVKGPFNTSFIAQNLAIEALKDQDYINKIIKLNMEVKSWFEIELKKLNIPVYPSEGNFTFIETTEKKSEEITKQLLATGILIRQLHSYKLPNCLRISIGTKNEMEAVINSLRQMK